MGHYEPKRWLKDYQDFRHRLRPPGKFWARRRTIRNRRTAKRHRLPITALSSRSSSCCTVHDWSGHMLQHTVIRQSTFNIGAAMSRCQSARLARCPVARVTHRTRTLFSTAILCSPFCTGVAARKPILSIFWLFSCQPLRSRAFH